MLPIAVLPVAGLLLRLGQPDLLNIKWIADAGGAVFTNLPLIFSIGVAVGFAKENHGAAALAGGIGYLILTAVLKSINDKLDMGVLAGILCGIVAGNLYNRFYDIKIPEYLAFLRREAICPDHHRSGVRDSRVIVRVYLAGGADGHRLARPRAYRGG